MALTLPTLDQLALHMGRDEFEEDDDADAATYALQQAADLFWLATGLTDDPTDPQVLRIVQYGIMDMAYWLLDQVPFKSAMHIPVVQERIGSYSYTKAQAILAGEPTGVLWFEQAISMVNQSKDTNLLVTSTMVFDYDLPIYVDSHGHRIVIGPQEIAAAHRWTGVWPLDSGYHDPPTGYPV